MNTRDMNVNHMNNEIIPAMNVNEKTKLCLAIIEQLPSDVKCALLAHQLSTLSHTTLSAVMNSLPDEVNTEQDYGHGDKICFLFPGDKHGHAHPVPKNKR